MSLIEVKCPHCGAKGQIMIPPPGAIIVAPCPECQGLVVVFCGQVLALKKETMLNSSIKEKREHLLSVLTDFLKQRVVELISDDDEVEKGAGQLAAPKAEMTERISGAALPQVRKDRKLNPISPDEMDRFRKDDLRLIDNPDYFKAIFG